MASTAPEPKYNGPGRLMRLWPTVAMADAVLPDRRASTRDEASSRSLRCLG